MILLKNNSRCKRSKTDLSPISFSTKTSTLYDTTFQIKLITKSLLPFLGILSKRFFLQEEVSILYFLCHICSFLLAINLGNCILYRWQIQAALGICGLFICDFKYIRLKNGLFSGTCSLIYGNPRSFYMQINYMRAYFLSPYLSHITRSTCKYILAVHNTHFKLFLGLQPLQNWLHEH